MLKHKKPRLKPHCQILREGKMYDGFMPVALIVFFLSLLP